MSSLAASFGWCSNCEREREEKYVNGRATEVRRRRSCWGRGDTHSIQTTPQLFKVNGDECQVADYDDEGKEHDCVGGRAGGVRESR